MPGSNNLASVASYSSSNVTSSATTFKRRWANCFNWAYVWCRCSLRVFCRWIVVDKCSDKRRTFVGFSIRGVDEEDDERIRWSGTSWRWMSDSCLDRNV